MKNKLTTSTGKIKVSEVKKLMKAVKKTDFILQKGDLRMLYLKDDEHPSFMVIHDPSNVMLPTFDVYEAVYYFQTCLLIQSITKLKKNSDQIDFKKFLDYSLNNPQ